MCLALLCSSSLVIPAYKSKFQIISAGPTKNIGTTFYEVYVFNAYELIMNTYNTLWTHLLFIICGYGYI